MLTYLVIAPLTMLIPPLWQPLFARYPLLAGTVPSNLLITLCIVPLVVFLIMPRVSRLCAPWLTPARAPFHSFHPQRRATMSTFTTRDGVEIYFKDWGSGKPVLFSHGWPLDADMWDYQMHHLASHGYRAIAFDRRGFGRSGQPWNGYDYDTFADDIKELIEHLDLRDVHPGWAFSMGGGDVSRYLARHGSARVAKLALLGAVTPLFGQQQDFPQGVDQSVFDGIRGGLLKDRAQFLADFAPVFYGTNQGQTVSAGVFTQTLNIALAGFAERHPGLRHRLLRDRLPAGHGQDRRADPGDPRRRRPGGALRDHRQAGRRADPWRRAQGVRRRPPRFAVTHAEQLNRDLLAFVAR